MFARAALFALLVACGSRTGLFGEGDPSFDTPDDLLPDGGRGRRDAAFDGPREPDALPPIDAQPPRDASRVGCPDAAATLVYLISEDFQLLSFDPDTGAVTTIGNIACPAGPNAHPFSMAVDRAGVAYVLFTDRTGGVGGGAGPDNGRIFRVSTATAACVATPYVPGQQNFRLFGMGFAANDVGPVESLFIAGSEQSAGAEGLARIDTTTFALTRVGSFVPRIVNAELTGTGDGRLFGFYTKANNNAPPTFIGEINTTTGQIVAETRLDDVTLGEGWAFAFWGGDFYMFTSPPGVGPQVTRYRPSNGTTQVIAPMPARIVGAGVSTCAPAQ